MYISRRLPARPFCQPIEFWRGTLLTFNPKANREMKSFFAFLILVLAPFAPAQNSPKVHPDRTVTFRLRAPNAKQVKLSLEGEKLQSLTLDDHGIWSITVGPLEPDFYPYTFAVDGLQMPDPANADHKNAVAGGGESLLHVPGPPTLTWELNDVPHGVIHRHLYKSPSLGDPREFLIYTPPGYEAGKAKYPVLYLLHGVMEDASGWISAGRADVILDNLIARHQAKPMLIVFPLGYGFADPGDHISKAFGVPSVQRQSNEAFTKNLADEIIPTVERSYRVEKGPLSRAIAGASLGGAQALQIGLTHPNLFGSVGALSGAFIVYGGTWDDWFPTRLPNPHLLFVSCGRSDFLLATDRKMVDWLKAKSLNVSLSESDGGHTWMVWRRNLSELLPRLFR